ncbi:MAG: zinc ribbon domain-containing protein [Candidatus Glassbacteria bacterium]|nr:zinc ribbon domain-containing protein [Candidatus Glassbacteria bacterium]
MPIFEYRCSKCGQVIEALEKSSEQNTHSCPSCGHSPMQRIFSSFGVDKGSSSSGGSCATGTCPFN